MRQAMWSWIVVVALLPSFADADIITSSPNLPPAGASYTTAAGATTTYVGSGFTAVISDLRLFGFTTSTPPPLDVGTSVLDVFDLSISGLFSLNGGPAGAFLGSGHAEVSVLKTVGANGSPLGEFETEILALQLVGLPGGAMLQESPTLQSKGKTKIVDEPGGLFRINSFFDVFTELSIDDGKNWVASVDPRFIRVSIPEPSAAVLVGLGLLGALGYARIRR